MFKCYLHVYIQICLTYNHINKYNTLVLICSLSETLNLHDTWSLYTVRYNGELDNMYCN